MRRTNYHTFHGKLTKIKLAIDLLTIDNIELVCNILLHITDLEKKQIKS